MATDHAVILGFGGEEMFANHGAFWMMVRLYVRLRRPVFSGEELTIHTWHRGAAKTVTVFRDFDLFVGDECVGEAVMSWVLADVEGRKIRKPATIPELADSPRPAQVKDIIPAKIKPPAEMERVMARPVYYSDTDINGHMNNTKYADIACDAIRYDRCNNQFISEVQINYLCECFPGEDIIVLGGEADGVHYIRGTDGAGKHRFDACIKLEEME